MAAINPNTTVPRWAKWGLFSLGYLGFALGYVGLQHISAHRAFTLGPSLIDRAIPFIDWSVWIYLSHFLLVLFTICLIKERSILTVTFNSLLLSSITSFLIYSLYPTRVQRVELKDTSLTAGAFQLLFATDGDTNCCPSLHAAIALICVIGGCRSHRNLSPLLLVWGVCIYISTLTTKQHYILDLLGGFVVGSLSHQAAILIESRSRTWG